jgi:hypothetical protein
MRRLDRDATGVERCRDRPPRGAGRLSHTAKCKRLDVGGGYATSTQSSPTPGDLATTRQGHGDRRDCRGSGHQPPECHTDLGARRERAQAQLPTMWLQRAGIWRGGANGSGDPQAGPSGVGSGGDTAGACKRAGQDGAPPWGADAAELVSPRRGGGEAGAQTSRGPSARAAGARSLGGRR